jgi:hypothetical protein
MHIIFKFLQLCLIFSLVSGCATTRQAKDVKISGFLGDYSQLKPGKDDQALLAYKNPNAPWSKYDSIMIDPVVVYTTSASDLNSDSREEKKALVNYFASSLHEELKKNFRIVNRPGRNVMRLRVALTDGDQSEVVLDTITTVMPIGLALSTVKRAALNSADTAVGFAQAEAEITDSQTGIRLAAAVDKRYGTKALRSKFGSWNHAQEAMKTWSEQISARLSEWGAGRK